MDHRGIAGAVVIKPEKMENSEKTDVENVDLDTVAAYKQKGEKHTFLEGYGTE